jgi:hypothetical protein
MGDLSSFGKVLILLGLGIVAMGVVLLLASRFGFPRLPGDVIIERKNFTFYAPIGLMILVSVLLTILLNLFARR